MQRLEAAEERRRAAERKSRQHVEKLLDALPDKLKKQETLSLSGILSPVEIEPEPVRTEEEAQPSAHEDFNDYPAKATLRNNVKIRDPSTADEIRVRMNNVLMKQKNHDFALDLADLRNLMREALETSSDDALLEILQIKPEKLPKILKQLQGALEEAKETESASGIHNAPRKLKANALGGVSDEPAMGISRSNTLPTRLCDFDIMDDLDKTFIECSIRALRRTRTL